MWLRASSCCCSVEPSFCRGTSFLLSSRCVILNISTKHKSCWVRVQGWREGKVSLHPGEGQRAFHFNHNFHMQACLLNRERKKFFKLNQTVWSLLFSTLKPYLTLSIVSFKIHFFHKAFLFPIIYVGILLVLMHLDLQSSWINVCIYYILHGFENRHMRPVSSIGLGAPLEKGQVFCPCTILLTGSWIGL